ncbi:HEAT repeat domain-containing protein [Couchioplanes caeruleus]|uniref:HEAT repeat domain-containing protein n=1 Tax=Couchioplanes caeruleus TaxID=56438 RepID=UPI0020C05A41|nr:HEAT repeat domain-containing protein [Couchioplanes caeruleus]UQU63015.1 HEAT repeat domain-containing protein [Couchioplanes caeruleus]
MLDGLDEVDWAALTHAYGAADDVPGLLREAALSELSERLLPPGTVHTATAAAVPYLVELAAAGRPEFVWMVGALAEHAPVRSTVLADRERLAPLLAHPDPRMREAAAYALAQLGTEDALLRARWSQEEDARVRASLVLALRLTDAITDPSPTVRAAAAVALARDGTPFPRNPAVIEAVATAAEAGAEVSWLHAAPAGWLDVVVRAARGTALLTRLVGSSSADVRAAAAWALTLRCQDSRSAPAELVPLLEPLLADPQTRDAAVAALRRCGRAAARFAGVLAEVAAGYPEVAASRAVTAELQAVETLLLIGDPRWVEPVIRAARDGNIPRMHARMPVSCSPPVLEAVRRALRDLAGDPGAGRAIEALCAVLARWEGAAGEAVPELVAALPSAPAAVTRALLAVGHLGGEMVAGLRTLAGEPGGLAAATALFRLTGDPGPALRALLTARPPVPAGIVAVLGPLAQPVVPGFELLLTGEAAASQPQCAGQLLAAQVVMAATGDTTAALRTVQAILRTGGSRAALAAAVVAELVEGGTAVRLRGELATWEPELRALLDDPRAVVEAAGALWRLGVPGADLVPAVLGAIDGGSRVVAAVGLLREMGATAEIATLVRRDRRIHAAGIDDDIVINDEVLRDSLAATG